MKNFNYPNKQKNFLNFYYLFLKRKYFLQENCLRSKQYALKYRLEFKKKKLIFKKKVIFKKYFFMKVVFFYINMYPEHQK